MAIAFDATGTGVVDPGASLTYSHVCTGSERYLLVGIKGSSTSDTITGCTYATVAMTLLRKAQITGSRWAYVFGLFAPASGANDVVVSASGSDFINAVSVSLTGVSQAEPEASNGAQEDSVTNHTGTVTTLTDNAWIMSHFACSIGWADVGSGDVRIQGDGNTHGIMTRGPMTPTGSYSNQAGAGGPLGNWQSSTISLAPFVAAAGGLMFPRWGSVRR